MNDREFRTWSVEYSLEYMSMVSDLSESRVLSTTPHPTLWNTHQPYRHDLIHQHLHFDRRASFLYRETCGQQPASSITASSIENPVSSIRYRESGIWHLESDGAYAIEFPLDIPRLMA